MQLKVWIDGKLVDKADAKISVYDHGLLYGDGVFEGIRVYHGKIFECDAHLERLYDSAKAIRLTIPLHARAAQARPSRRPSRPTASPTATSAWSSPAASATWASTPTSCAKPSVFVIADLIELYPQEMYEKGMAVITASVIRNHPNALSPRVKSLNYLNNILAKIEAIDAGVPEAIMLNHEGNVAECTADNIFIVRSGQVLDARPRPTASSKGSPAR